MIKKFSKFQSSLYVKYIIFLLFILFFILFFLSNIYNFYHREILKNSLERELSSYLHLLNALDSEIDYYANQLIQLEELRIKKNEIQNKSYQTSKENTIKILKHITKKDLKSEELSLLFQYASSLATAKLNQDRNQFDLQKKDLYEYLQYLFDYQEKNKNIFATLNFNKYRLQSVDIHQWKRFDTKDILNDKETMINKILWEDPILKDPINLIYKNYKKNRPILQTFASQFTYESIPFLFMIKINYRNPEIYERSIRILQSFESKEKYQWEILIKNVNKINQTIKEIYKKVKNKEKENDIKFLYRNSEYRELIRILNESINKKRNYMEEFSYNLLKTYNPSFSDYINKKQHLEIEIKNRQKELLQYSIENTEARVPILKEIRRLKFQLNEMEEEKKQWIFNESLQLIDAYLYLQDYVIYKKIFFEYRYESNRYKDYIVSKDIRIFYQTLFQDIQDWLFSPFDKPYFEKYDVFGFFLYDQKVARDIFIEFYTKDLKELAKTSLIENSIGFTKVLVDLREHQRDTLVLESNFKAVLIALSLRYVILSILIIIYLLKKT